MYIHQMSPRVACSTLILGFHEEPEGDEEWSDGEGPESLQEWKDRFLETVERAQQEEHEFFFYRSAPPHSRMDMLVGHDWTEFGAIYTQTLSSRQPVTESYLKKMGFKRIGSFYNDKNGTRFTSWIISTRALQRAFKKIDTGELV